MPQPRKIYLLDPKCLSPETIAVAFAKTSRSPRSFDTIAAELSDEKSADFHEKWVVGYGHSSVAEHAVLHLAVENISRLAIECLESNRLASYTEKSSRYQIWNEDSFFVPDELSGSSLKTEYLELSKMLFSKYLQAVSQVTKLLFSLELKKTGEGEKAYQLRIRSLAADACRYYLPACALANVGITINARALEHAIVKMLSHPLHEVREIGQKIKEVSQKNLPTLVKYANENDYLKYFNEKYPFSVSSVDKPVTFPFEWFRCVDGDENGEERILAALLFRFSQIPMVSAETVLQNLSPADKKHLAEELIGRLKDHDIPLRELEYADISFEITMDQGAYFEFKRHRMMTQTPQWLSTFNGFALPSLLHKAGLGEEFIRDMATIQSFYTKCSRDFPFAASYIVPNAFNRRVMVKMNLRSALHFTRLRSAPNAHYSIRRVALRIIDEISDRFPQFTSFFQSKSGETYKTIEERYFSKLF